MRRSTGVADSRVLAGLQILVGYYAVERPTTTSAAPVDRSVEAPDVSFAVTPERIANDLWLVFRGRRDPGTGTLVGEIVPDFQMRLLGLAPGAVFAVAGAGALVAGTVGALLDGRRPSLFGLLLPLLALCFSGVWIHTCGGAVHEVVRNVRRDSPRALVLWRPGLRTGSRTPAPPPPAGASSIEVEEQQRVRSRASAWLGLLGLVVPIAIVALVVVPAIRSNAARSDWVRVSGTAGKQVDLDHRTVAYVLPDGTERATTVSVMRTVEPGDVIDLYYPPGRPDLIEQDRSGFVLPYLVFGGFAALVAVVVIVRFVVQLRRSRPAAPPS